MMMHLGFLFMFLDARRQASPAAPSDYRKLTAVVSAVGRVPLLDGGLLAIFDFEMRIFDYSKDISIRVCHRRHDNAPSYFPRV